MPDVTAAFSVLSFSATEGISTPFEVNLSVGCDTTVTGDMVLGREGLLTIVNEPFAEYSPTGVPTQVDTNRYFHGVISRFTYMGKIGTDLNQYTIRLVPDLWFLSLEKDCRIFQNMTVPEIVHELSRLFALRAGDLVFMGTPAGVGPLVPGDFYAARIDAILELRGQVSDPR